MTTLEKIKLEITSHFLWDGEIETDLPYAVQKCLEIIDKYADQEPTDTWSIKDVADTLAKHGLIADQEPTTRKSCETCIGKSRYVDGMDLCEDCENCSNFKPKQTEKTTIKIWGEDKPFIVCNEDAYDKKEKPTLDDLWTNIKKWKEEVEQGEDAYDKVLAYLKANVDDFPDYHEVIEAVLKMKGGE